MQMKRCTFVLAFDGGNLEPVHALDTRRLDVDLDEMQGANRSA